MLNDSDYGKILFEKKNIYIYIYMYMILGDFLLKYFLQKMHSSSPPPPPTPSTPIPTLKCLILYKFVKSKFEEKQSFWMEIRNLKIWPWVHGESY